MESFSSSYHHNKSITGAPLGRIIMMGPKILYGKREYTSASEALEDYISEFEGIGRKLKLSYSQQSRKDVLDLLTAGQSPNVYEGTHRLNGATEHLTQDPNCSSMGLGKGLSLRELQSSSTLTGNLSRVDISRASIEESFRRMKEVDDAFEVAHTLNQSHDVLKRVEEDRLSGVGESPSRCDMRSLATESLISVNPYPLSSDVTEVTALAPNPEPQRRGHIYSYRIPRSRSQTVSGINFTQASNKFVGETNGAFKNDAAFKRTGYRATLPHSGQGRQLTADKESLGTSRYRSRSASPNAERSRYNPGRGRRQAPSWLENLDSSRDSRLSAVGNLRAPSGARRTPSWIEDIVGSTASSVSDIKQLPLSSDQLSVESECYTVSDSKSSSSYVPPVLYASDLNIGTGSGVEPAERRRPASAYIHTSTPLKPKGTRNDISAKIGLANGLPDRFRIPADSLDGKTVSSISLSNSRLARSLENTADLRVNCSENEDKIGKMLKELDVIKTKLKSSSEDTTSCLREIAKDQRGDNFTETPCISSSQGQGKSDCGVPPEDCPAVSSFPQEDEQEQHTLATHTSHGLNPSSSPSSGVTDELLEDDRPWKRAPAPVVKSSFSDEDTRGCGASRPGVIRNFLDDCLNEGSKQGTQTSSQDTLGLRSLDNLKAGRIPSSQEAFQSLSQGSQQRSLDAVKILSRESQGGSAGSSEAPKILKEESQWGLRDPVKISSEESQQGSVDAVKIQSREFQCESDAVKLLSGTSEHGCKDTEKIISWTSQLGSKDAVRILSGASQQESKDAMRILRGASQQGSKDAVRILSGASQEDSKNAMKILSGTSQQGSKNAMKVLSGGSLQGSKDAMKVLSGGSQQGSKDAMKVLSGGSQQGSKDAMKVLSGTSHHESAETEKTLSGGSQPGSMEALKNMLFKLQSEAPTSQQEDCDEERDIAMRCRDLGDQHVQIDDVDDVIDPDRLALDDDFNTGPGAECLERALVHLSRLKTLVQSSAFNPEPRNKSTLNALPSNP